MASATEVARAKKSIFSSSHRDIARSPAPGPHSSEALLLTGHHAQAPAVLDHSRALPPPCSARRSPGAEFAAIIGPG